MMFQAENRAKRGREADETFLKDGEPAAGRKKLIPSLSITWAGNGNVLVRVRKHVSDSA